MNEKRKQHALGVHKYNRVIMISSYVLSNAKYNTNP